MIEVEIFLLNASCMAHANKIEEKQDNNQTTYDL